MNGDLERNAEQTQEVHQVDISHIEVQNSHQKAQDEVHHLLSRKQETEKILEQKLEKLKQAQEEYEQAVAENSHASKSLIDANSKLANIDLKMPGQWNTMYHKLVAFKHEHGHCNVAQDRSLRSRDMRDEDNDRKALGRWVGNQRVFYKYYLNGDTRHIKPHRIAALNEIGFVWDIKERKWMDKYNSLAQYKRLHGHCRISGRENKDLSEWARRQRYQYSRMRKNESSTLTEERVRMLEEIGFEFETSGRT